MPSVNKPTNKLANDTTEDGVGDPQRKDRAANIPSDLTATTTALPDDRPTEYGGQSGPEPTRYGDWEKKGRCTDF